MKFFRSLRPALAILLIAILFSMVTYVPTAKADEPVEDFPEREVDLLLLYDPSYAAFLSERCGITDPVHRLEQMANMAAIPFKETLNITLNVTVMSYLDTLGQPYAMSCPDVYPADAVSIGDKVTHHWEYNAQCNCYNRCFPGTGIGTYHHNSISHLSSTADQYARDHSDFDTVGVYFGHLGCYMYAGQHFYPLGVGAQPGYGFAVYGIEDVVENDPYQVINILSNMSILNHELSHNFGLNDAILAPFTPYNCSENEPCIMQKGHGFKSVVYAKNIWCANCLYKFSENGGGMAGHFDGNN